MKGPLRSPNAYYDIAEGGNWERKERIRNSAGILALSLVVAPALAPTPCGARQPATSPLVTDRPSFSASALAVALGAVQLEVGYTLTRNDAVDAHTLGEVLIRIGILPGAELRLGLNSFAWTDDPLGDASGLEDVSLGVKVELTEGGGKEFNLLRPRVALSLSTSLPTGTGGFGEKGVQPGATLAMSWELSKRLGLGANANVAAASQDGDRFGQFSGAVALGVSLADRVGAYGEYFLFAPPGPGNDVTGFLNGGLTFLATNDFQFDVRAGFGVHGVDGVDTDFFCRSRFRHAFLTADAR